MEPQSVFVRVGDHDYHYVDWGRNGPPLLLLHGGRRNCRSWDAVARLLADNYWVIALDAKGHGDSAKPTRGYSYAQRTEDLQNFLDVIGWDVIYAIGHSAGANTMGLHAAAYPGRLRAFMLIEAVIVASGTLDPTFYQRIKNQRRSWESRDALSAYLRQHPETGKWRSDVIDAVVEHEVVVKPNGAVEMKWSTDVYNMDDLKSDTYNLVTSAAAITAPSFLVYSATSFIPRSDIEAFHDALSQNQLVYVEGAGHNIYMEQPDLVAEHAAQFFRQP